MASKHQEKWTELCRPLFLSPYRKCNIFQIIVQIVLVFINQFGKTCFEGFVGPFIKAISLRVACTGHRTSDPKLFAILGIHLVKYKVFRKVTCEDVY